MTSSMELPQIHRALGITAQHLASCKLTPHAQPPLQELVVADIDFEGKPFVLHKAVAPPWAKMVGGAAEAGIVLKPFSGFRSYGHQRRLIEGHLRNGRPLSDILTHVAIPGFSEHHSGLAVDVHADGRPVLEEEFERGPEFAWLERNAGQFGFRLSYPRGNDRGIVYEPWHWFYIGG